MNASICKSTMLIQSPDLLSHADGFPKTVFGPFSIHGSPMLPKNNIPVFKCWRQNQDLI